MNPSRSEFCNNARVMEYGPSEEIFAGPRHPYTEVLLSAASEIGKINEGRIRLTGEIPSASRPPSGCVFHTRCPRRLGRICEEQAPPLTEVRPGRTIRCHIPHDELAVMQGCGSGDPAVLAVPVAAGGRPS